MPYGNPLTNHGDLWSSTSAHWVLNKPREKKTLPKLIAQIIIEVKQCTTFIFAFYSSCIKGGNYLTEPNWKGKAKAAPKLG